MKEVIFSTGNEVKLQEATEACRPFDINIIHRKLDVEEIQSHDPMKIAVHKAKTAYDLVLKPVVINDSFWEITALNGFPGGYMKDIFEWFSTEDFINLMQGKADRRVSVTECVIYQDSTMTKLITKKYWGEIAKQPSGIGNSFEKVAVFNGMTIGEHHRLGKFAYDPKDYIWNDFAEWLISYNQ
jgi:non-canonical purine NTP pyrophosphatase (RdgB/HAM1 family)